jgi:ABC-2 type transport system ATP-binding protein
MTVLLSSHILGEVQLICDSVTIISAGRRVAAGPVAEVLARHASTAVRVRLEAGVDLLGAAEVLRAAGARWRSSTTTSTVGNAPNPAQITRVLAQRDIYVSELAPVGVDLESVFLELTGTAPVEGQNRQVDQAAVPAAQGGWGQ